MFKHWSASNIIAFVAVVSPAFTLFMQYRQQIQSEKQKDPSKTI